VGATILYQGAEARADQAEADGESLWVTLPDLTATTGWQLKPEGVCKDEICVPVPGARRAALIRDQQAMRFFNLTEFARLIEQPYARDKRHAVWYFGPAGWEWKTRLESTVAPDFELPDLSGRMHRLSELRGKKVFLLFWASW
jgi:hypothetical protein